jgi:hypothetical protein
VKNPNFLKEQFEDQPIGTILAVVSCCAVLLGIVQGVNRGAFKPDALQQTLETRQQTAAIQKQTIALANDRYDAGCEGVFYLKPGTSVYQPLTEGSGVLSGEYWNRWNKAKVKPTPNPTDYLPSGTTVCDAYGNVGILATTEKGKPALVTDLLNTPDRKRINAMMNRYPTAHRPQVGS